MPRLRRKVARGAFFLLHQRWRLPARARVHLAAGPSFAVDCANTAYLDFAARSGRAEGYEPEISGLFSHLAPRLGAVYDVGANWGYYPLLLTANPKFRGEIHAFEVRRQTADDLRHVIAAAGLAGRVSVHAVGLSDVAAEVRLCCARHSYLVRIVPASYRGPVDIADVKPLDALDLPAPDLIKIDVEGHEAAVLRGAARTIARTRPLVVFESWYMPEDRDGMLEPLRFLADRGYQLYRLTWRAENASVGAQHGVVALESITAEDRSRIATGLNLLAVPPDRAAAFF